MRGFCLVAIAGACFGASTTLHALADDAADCPADASTSPRGAACAGKRGSKSQASSLIQTAGRLAKADSGQRPCDGGLTSKCCGDSVCDGPETTSNCPADCPGGGVDASTTISPSPPVFGAKPCDGGLTSKCCGDGVCDGPETPSSCPTDCSGDASPPGTAPSPAPSGGGGVRQCTDQITQFCCGDGLCGGPETAGNCYDDCAGDGDGEGPGEPDGPVPSPAPGDACTTVPAEKPVVPTLCTSENQGCCDCGTVAIQTYVFWTQDGTVQRCFHAHNFPSSAPSEPMPVVLHMDGYSGGRKGPETGSDMSTAAIYYGFVAITVGNLLKDGAGGFGLEFGNNGIANDDNPAPCSSGESREIEYLEEIFQFIAGQPTLLNASRVYTEGFSQNSMFAAYTAVCFADRVAGAWQGGSGQSRTGSSPVAPGFQGQCSFDAHALHGSDCCDEDFCTDCQYWPLWPKTCSHKIVDCIAAYTDDTIACGSDWYMYEAMRQEGNDARLLSFPVPDGDSSGGHRDPQNKWAWFAGCLGVAPPCSDTCVTSFEGCVQAATEAKTYEKFAKCESVLKDGDLAGCAVGCAPTLAMLMLSESPSVTLSQGKFGNETGLPSAGNQPAPMPNCKKDFGLLSSTGPGPAEKCTPPAGYAPPAINPEDTCG